MPLTNRHTNIEEWVGDALALGAIPILQGNDEWYVKMLSDLPVIWESQLEDLTPDLLDLEWEGILQEDSFQYSQLTQRYWVDKALQKVAAEGSIAGKTKQQVTTTVTKKKRKRGKKKKTTTEGDEYQT